jgi:phosphopantothenoylcysteine decarboxylase/phosphopantothenate--cysteine ligase
MIAVVTTGPASAPIDGVRRITNFASGEIGALLAEALVTRGFEPLLFRARGATHIDVPVGVPVQEFETNHDLARALEHLSETRASDVRAVFHAAALSDYTVSAVRGPEGSLSMAHKIPGRLPQIHLVLEPAAKILPQLRGWFPRAWIAGWKYELEGTREDAVEAARTQLTEKRTDATVLNGAAYGPGFALLQNGQSPVHFPTKREVAQFLASQASAFAKSHE